MMKFGDAGLEWWESRVELGVIGSTKPSNRNTDDQDKICRFLVDDIASKIKKRNVSQR